ncbi:hypothetical protein [Thalassorhabdomicrobium marinisediminis]|uniref:hypothetical protein n=1 Tax=Thalassorhabdomicrobium marinisediminis TaxID=2170577 RepID=UPI001F542940|nr:hypothetical protein [Thalassorhabdomicrobium marinisediminis]
MSTKPGGPSTDHTTAAARIEEARQLFETIGTTLSAVLELVSAGDFKDIDLLPRQMARLTDALADIRKKEADFNEKFSDQPAGGEIDFDDLRHEIGCRLNRIRQCCRPQGVSGQSDE